MRGGCPVWSHIETELGGVKMAGVKMAGVKMAVGRGVKMAAAKVAVLQNA